MFHVSKQLFYSVYKERNTKASQIKLKQKDALRKYFSLHLLAVSV